MREAIEKVRKFSEMCEYPLKNSPGFPTDEVQLQCQDLLKEEVREFLEAHGKFEGGGNIVEIADALGDILYSVIFTALSYGIPLAEVFDEIHRSNMTKPWPDGKARKRQLNRLEKGPNYESPRLDLVLKTHLEARFKALEKKFLRTSSFNKLDDIAEEMVRISDELSVLSEKK